MKNSIKKLSIQDMEQVIAERKVIFAKDLQ